MLKSLNRSSLNIVKEGSGPIVVLSHALGCNLHMWDAVARIMKNDFTVVRYDHRNHGVSAFSKTPFSVDDLADDAAELIDNLGDDPVFFVGLSLGGMVAQSLAARYPNLVSACVIANSAEYYDDEVKKMWSDRIDRVKREGVSAISGMAIERWFTPEYLSSEDPTAKEIILDIKSELDSFDSQAYSLSCGAVSDVDCRKGNQSIQVPTLVLFGLKDQATPPALSEAIHKSIQSSELAGIDAAHLSAVEKPLEFAAITSKFLLSKRV
jgi:3-oxoadipate enol-lactonase